MLLANFIRQLNWQRIQKSREIRFKIVKRLWKPNIKTVSLTELQKGKNIIVWGGGGIGDAIVMSGFVKVLIENGFEVSVIASERNSAFFNKIKMFKKVFVIKEERYVSSKELLKIYGKQKFDLLIVLYGKDSFIEAYALLKFYKIFNIRYIMGFDDSLGLYDVSINYMGTGLSKRMDEHFSKRFDYLLAYFGITEYNLSYCTDIPQKYIAETRSFLDLFKNKKIICFNPFSSTDFRDFSLEQIKKILNYLDSKKDVEVILVGTQKQLCLLKNSELPKTAIVSPFADFLYVAGIVKFADLVISTDTSIVHLANAYNKKLICVYNNRILEHGEQNNIVWGPNYRMAIQLFTKDKKGTQDGDYIRNFDVKEMYKYIDKDISI